jgi:hypothetical protein
MTFFKYRGQTFNGAIYLNTCRIDSTKNGASLALALSKGQKSTIYAFILRVFLNASRMAARIHFVEVDCICCLREGLSLEYCELA